MEQEIYFKIRGFSLKSSSTGETIKVFFQSFSINSPYLIQILENVQGIIQNACMSVSQNGGGEWYPHDVNTQEL